MHSAIFVSALVGLASAAPHSYSIERDIGKRQGTCARQPSSFGPVSKPDTPDAFLANAAFWEMATHAQTPAGYTQIFRNVTAAVNSFNVINYLTYHDLSSYDTLACRARCDQTAGCVAFNIYVERDPSLDPNDDACPNPGSDTNFKCALFDKPVSIEEATNCGQWRSKFHVVISASNAYNKGNSNVTVANFTDACSDAPTTSRASWNTTSVSNVTNVTTPEIFTGVAGQASTVNYSMLSLSALAAISYMAF